MPSFPQAFLRPLSHPPACLPACLQVQRQYPQMGELAAMLEEGVLEKAAKGMWGTSSKEGRYSK